MWVIFEKDSERIVGMSAHGGIELGKEEALKEVVSGLEKPKALKVYNAFQVKDLQRITESMNLPLDQLSLKKDKKGKIIDIDTQSKIALLHLSSNAKDRHKVDGIGEIPADGKSRCTITIRKIDIEGNLLTRQQDNDELFLRTDAGSIRDARGRKEIRMIRLNKGTASFRLCSEEKKRMATIQVFSTDPNLMDANISIEFI